MNEMEHFEHLDRFELRASDIKDGIHASLACITCPRLENITTFYISFHESPLGWFDFAKIGKSINRRIKSIETD